MKKLFIVLTFLALTSSVFAQEGKPDNSDPFYAINNTSNIGESFYYINVRVEKIYPSSQGYVIQYRSSTDTVSTIGIPNEWFTDAASKAEIVRLPQASDWPTMSVFYKNSEFSHVRLYVHPAKSHLTWGNIPQGINVDRFFSDKDFKLQF